MSSFLRRTRSLLTFMCLVSLDTHKAQTLEKNRNTVLGRGSDVKVVCLFNMVQGSRPICRDVLTRALVEVLGVDINPTMQPEEMPANLYLQVDDLNGRYGQMSCAQQGQVDLSRFTFPAHNFDLVHSQMMASSIHSTRWPQYMRDMFRVTRPGGWCQMVELYFQVQSDNGSLTEG